MAVGTVRLKPNTLDVHFHQYRSIEAHISWSEDVRTELNPPSRLNTCVVHIFCRFWESLSPCVQTWGR